MKLLVSIFMVLFIVAPAIAEEAVSAGMAGAASDMATASEATASTESVVEVEAPSRPGERVANNFGDALDRSGKEVSKNLPETKKVANNFGDALTQVGKGVSSVFGGKK